MGELFLHNLAEFNCNVFVETGTGKGTGLQHALKYDFETLYSIEIHPDLYKECNNKFNQPNINLILGDSINGLTKILPQISKNSRILFWLDAHFPGADFQLANYDDNIPMGIKLPLQTELQLISQMRYGCADVFIIDDLQLFEEGDYELKADDTFLKKYRKSPQFIYDILSETHNVKKDYRHQGFMIWTIK